MSNGNPQYPGWNPAQGQQPWQGQAVPAQPNGPWQQQPQGPQNPQAYPPQQGYPPQGQPGQPAQPAYGQPAQPQTQPAPVAPTDATYHGWDSIRGMPASAIPEEPTFPAGTFVWRILGYQTGELQTDRKPYVDLRLHALSPLDGVDQNQLNTLFPDPNQRTKLERLFLARPYELRWFVKVFAANILSLGDPNQLVLDDILFGAMVGREFIARGEISDTGYHRLVRKSFQASGGSGAMAAPQAAPGAPAWGGTQQTPQAQPQGPAGPAGPAGWGPPR